MSEQRWVRLSTEKPTSTIYVLDTEISLDVCGSAPTGVTAFDVWGTPGINLYIIHNTEVLKIPSCVPRWPLDAKIEVIATMDTPSSQVDEDKVRISYYKENGKVPVAKAVLHLTCVEISLDADTTRSGTVTRRDHDKVASPPDKAAPKHQRARQKWPKAPPAESGFPVQGRICWKGILTQQQPPTEAEVFEQLVEPVQKNWTWGPDGRGAILLVNCDRDDPEALNMDNEDKKLQSFLDRRDMSLMVLTTRGPDDIFEDNRLLLHISASDSDKLGIFHAQGKKLCQHKHVLGSKKLCYAVEWTGQKEHVFYVEGLAFPDANFSGLVSVHATLLEATTEGFPEAPIFNDKVVFRMAPWIMTPNTLQPVAVYVCSVAGNADFLANLTKLALKAGCKCIICPEEENWNDRWIQDEMEFGYVQAPHKTFPVVFDSPRNRDLKDYPFKSVLGRDFGYVTREPADKTSVSNLDSFGNLEVSPPVTVKGKEYPLGRILIGSHFPSPRGQEMAQVVRDFLYAQQVQSPVELYSDWLQVGHIDEFFTFVPASDRKGFRLLLASPSACFQLLREKKQEGYGDALMFEGLEKKKQVSIRTILGDKSLRNSNEYFQKCIDWNRNILKEELDLTEEDIIDLPQLFSPVSGKASAYFPDMVNMLVLGKYLGIPKPFGPVIHDQCCLEEKVRSLLEPLGLSCTFIDDFETYHKNLGEIHCGTNVRRKPFAFKWWNMTP